MLVLSCFVPCTRISYLPLAWRQMVALQRYNATRNTKSTYSRYYHNTDIPLKATLLSIASQQEHLHLQETRTHALRVPSVKQTRNPDPASKKDEFICMRL